MNDVAAVPAPAAAQDRADRRWLAARLGDARREVLATRRWAWQLNDERDTLAQEVARLEQELASLRAASERRPTLTLVPDSVVALGWPDAFPTVHLAPLVEEAPVVDGALALAPVAEPAPEQEWPQSSGAWGRRRGALALNVLPSGASRKERRSRHGRRG